MNPITLQITPLTIVIATAVALLLVFIVARTAAGSKVVTKVVKSVEDEAMEIVEKQIAFLADNTADRRAIDAANQSIADRAKRVSKLQSQVAALAPPTLAAPAASFPLST